jgi:hypothetical protein
MYGLRYGLFALFLEFVLPATGSAQLVGRLSLDKSEYVAGEPIYLRHTVTNTGTAPVQITVGDAYGPCGGYRIELSSEPSLENSTCLKPVVVNCIIGGWIIEPGAMHQDEVLLNYEHDLSAPGTYEVRASRHLTYGPKGNMTTVGPQTSVEERFRIRVEPSSPEQLLAILQPYITDLSSKDEETLREAGRVIGSLAPPFLEDTVISMLGSRTTRSFALRGLRRLNTVRARQTLAEIVKETAGYSTDKEQAIQFLSEMGDKKYFPLLLEEAEKHPPNQGRDDRLAAARLGGEEAMPFVNSLLTNPNAFLHGYGVMALSETGSRRAVPLLIDLLRHPNVDVGRLASKGLIELTHRSPLKADQRYSDSPSGDYAAWIRWWIQEGDRAPIYGPLQCGKIDALTR